MINLFNYREGDFATCVDEKGPHYCVVQVGAFCYSLRSFMNIVIYIGAFLTLSRILYV